jgi:hypothetical protein
MRRTILSSGFIGRLVILALAVAMGGILYVAAFAPTKAEGQDTAPLDLYVHTNYSGVHSSFYRSDPDLTNNKVGNDQVSSLAIDPGCTVTLYEHTEYGVPWTPPGRSITFNHNVPDLNAYGFNDITSSLKLFC